MDPFKDDDTSDEQIGNASGILLLLLTSIRGVATEHNFFWLVKGISPGLHGQLS